MNKLYKKDLSSLNKLAGKATAIVLKEFKLGKASRGRRLSRLADLIELAIESDVIQTRLYAEVRRNSSLPIADRFEINKSANNSVFRCLLQIKSLANSIH